MVASPEMRAIRDLPLAVSLALTAFAVLFGGGPGDGSLPWLGGGALLALVVLVATQGVPGGSRALLPLALLTCWMAITIAWSVLPDRSWAYANRALVYLLFAALGLWTAARKRELALGLMAVFGAVLAWSLLGKVLPFVYDYGPPDVGRLRGPVGLWNQLALIADFALPLALWRRRIEGALLAYVALVALLLTYSRGGIVTAVAVVVAWFVLDDDVIDSARTLVAAVVPAAVVVGIAFALPGVTGDGESLHTRWRDGLIFGALLLIGAAAALYLRRLPLPRVSRRVLVAAGAVVVALLVVAVVIKGSGSGAVGNSSGRLTSTSSNFRFTWWKQAVRGAEHHLLAGTGAGSFHVTNLRYRDSYLDYTTEPHDLPLQMLSETGIVGLVLFGLATFLLLRGSLRRRGHELALALVLPAFLLHSLVDVDWDFVAVSAPAFLVAGALAGGFELRRVSPFATLVAAGVALLAFGALLLPWLGDRWSGQASAAASPQQSIKLANRARSVDPLLVDPLWALALAAEEQGKPRLALAYYEEAVKKQPKNPQTLLLAGLFALDNGCPRLAYSYLEPFSELNHNERPDKGPDQYRESLRLVNTGKPTC
jgi:O-antigen ligase